MQVVVDVYSLCGSDWKDGDMTLSIRGSGVPGSQDLFPSIARAGGGFLSRIGRCWVCERKLFVFRSIG